MAKHSTLIFILRISGIIGVLCAVMMVMAMALGRTIKTYVVAYVSDVSTRDVFVTDLERDLTVRLTDSAAAETNLLWSPDGSHLLFLYAWPEVASDTIYVMHDDGTDLRQLFPDSGSSLTDDGAIHYLRWSPKSDGLYFGLQTVTGFPAQDTVVWIDLESATIDYPSIDRPDVQAYMESLVPKTGNSPDGSQRVYWDYDDEDERWILYSQIGDHAERVCCVNSLFDEVMTPSKIEWAADSSFFLVYVQGLHDSALFRVQGGKFPAQAELIVEGVTDFDLK